MRCKQSLAMSTLLFIFPISFHMNVTLRHMINLIILLHTLLIPSCKLISSIIIIVTIHSLLPLFTPHSKLTILIGPPSRTHDSQWFCFSFAVISLVLTKLTAY